MLYGEKGNHSPNVNESELSLTRLKGHFHFYFIKCVRGRGKILLFLLRFLTFCSFLIETDGPQNIVFSLNNDTSPKF